MPQPPKGLSPEAQLPLLQLSGGCGGNRSNTGTLACLINSLCSRVVAIKPAVWAALGAGQGSPRLLAPCLPNFCRPLSLSLGRGAREGFCVFFWQQSSLASVHVLTPSHSWMLTEHLLCAKEIVPAVSLCSWKRMGSEEQMRS